MKSAEENDGAGLGSLPEVSFDVGEISPLGRRPVFKPIGPLNQLLEDIYQRLLNAFGPQRWWPADSPFEVCVGAILTQNTNWINVSRAIDNLRSAGLLSPAALADVPLEAISRLIRPAGYYNVKALRLKGFIGLLREKFGGDLDKAFTMDLQELRPILLGVKGIGPETADSMLLYAGGYPVFVVDAYTMRVLARHDIIGDEACYESVQSLFMDNLPLDASMYNEYHALMVALGKGYCKKTGQRCELCPLCGV